MPKKNDFKLDVVSVRLVKDAPIYSEHTFNNPADIAAVMGDCMCQFDREVVCVVNLRSDLKPINVHFASVGSLNEAMAHPRELFKSSILSNAASMMLIHCHPSGNVFPSKADTCLLYTSLSGAVYGIYSDSGCTNRVQTMTTDGNGYAKSAALVAGTYYVKEITAPKGYVLSGKVHRCV